jgi:hypothetical protein
LDSSRDNDRCQLSADQWRVVKDSRDGCPVAKPFWIFSPSCVGRDDVVLQNNKGWKKYLCESLNPFADITIGERRKDTIFICAMLVVAIFASMYVVGLWPSIRIIFAWICGL